ncbi:MAG TPA: aldo/keto reductase [Chthonomonas sp.]|uniref:aldo/keto reductase n=1 Tax=Chthonomonas sp. TaxID=2282153 RepID=UPI002B4B7773|nr:aldo/keto reductase [Chthonomonas sp.]HLI49540.1 aldo/keto reductase [Chthonomonas sp.]
MERRVLGKTGLEVSVLGFGGAEIGYLGAEASTVERLLNSALDAGLNVIDTAECYSNGQVSSEELIGQAIAHRRSECYLFTKCGHASGLDYPDWSPTLLERSIERSLRRLRTDYLDLIQLHTCSLEVLQRGEVIEVLQRARDAGKARFIGYSGDNEAALYALECGAFDTLQTSISIADQRGIDLLLPVARRNNIGVIVKRPIANAVWLYKERPTNGYIAPYWERLQKLQYRFLADPEEAAATALRFVIGLPGVHTAIVGTTKPERWQQNAKLLEAGGLEPEQIEEIRRRWKEVAEANWVTLS